jgi:hypothetical protein
MTIRQKIYHLKYDSLIFLSKIDQIIYKINIVQKLQLSN